MITFDIEKFVRKYMTKRPVSLLAADFAKYSAEMHAAIDGKKMLVVGGAGTIGSNYVKAALRSFKPAAMYVVDIDENQLTELTRELRADSAYTVPATYVTEPIDLGPNFLRSSSRRTARSTSLPTSPRVNTSAPNATSIQLRRCAKQTSSWRKSSWTSLFRIRPKRSSVSRPTRPRIP